MKLKLTEKTLATYINKAILSELNEYGFNDAFLWKGQQPNQVGSQATLNRGNSVEIDPAVQQKISAQNAAKTAKTATPAKQSQPAWSDDHYKWKPSEQPKPSNYVEKIEPQETQAPVPTAAPSPAPTPATAPENGQTNTPPQAQNEPQGHPFTSKFKVEQFQTWYNLKNNFRGNVKIDGIYGPITKSKWEEYLRNTQTSE